MFIYNKTKYHITKFQYVYIEDTKVSTIPFQNLETYHIGFPKYNITDCKTKTMATK